MREIELRHLFLSFAILIAVLVVPIRAQTGTDEQLAFAIYKELVEINTVTATGDTGVAADAMADRLRAAGFDDNDVEVFKPTPRKGNLVARLRGNGSRKPLPRTSRCCPRQTRGLVL